jgi:hypothetical protein
LRKNEKPWNTNPYDPEEITEHYLGLALQKANAERIVGMARAINPNIEVFKVTRRPTGCLGSDHA